jgi:hypothetical protein
MYCLKQHLAKLVTSPAQKLSVDMMIKHSTSAASILLFPPPPPPAAAAAAGDDDSDI